MKDAALNFLVSLATAVVVLFILGPTMMRLNGVEPTTAGVAAESPAASAAPTAAPASVPTTPPSPEAKPHELTAPNLQGVSVKTARDRWRDHGIIIIEDGERVDPSVEPGTVIEQLPSAGAPLAQKEIRVVVAKPPELVTVPDVVGGKLEDARKLLVDAGFEVPPETREAAAQAAGTVIRQEPNPGAKSEPGAIVRIVVASETIEIPRLRGKSISRAKSALEKAGLTVGKVTQREDPELSGRRVLNQSPAAGERVAPGTVVDLVIVAPD
jgi:serine/threonine-protein kinase